MTEPVGLRVYGDDPRRYLSGDGDKAYFAHRAFLDVEYTPAVLGLLVFAINIRAIRNAPKNATPNQVGNIIILRTRLQNGSFHPHLRIVTAELSHYSDDIGGVKEGSGGCRMDRQ